MNVDRFVAEHSPTWARLEALTGRAARGARRLPPEELDELITLYQRVSTHLSLARTTYKEPALVARLTGLTARASAAVYGTRPPTLRAVGRFFTGTLPAALWRTRAFTLIAAAIFMAPAVGLGVWLANSPRALDAAAPPALREAYVEEDFADYYTSEPAAQFAASVTTNNIQVSFLAFAAGIAFCYVTVLVLVLNGANLGFAGGLFGAAGELPRFFGLILPHGLLELTLVFVAGGAGLRLGWTLIDPGDRPRGAALVEEGRRAVVIVIGITLAFVCAGLIEGFVTGSPLPTWARAGIGVIAEATFLAYVVVVGRAAVARGLTGAIGEERDAGWSGLDRSRRPAVTAP